MRCRTPAALILMAVVAVGCDTASPVAPANAGAQFAYMNGPDDLPNVIRFEGRLAVGIQDPDTDLWAIAGLPDVPSAHTRCGGTEPFETSPIQDAGQLQEVIHRLVSDGDINFHVYRRSAYVGFCRSTVLAQGTGRLMATDNDLTFSGTRNNTWGWHMVGPVTVVETGESLRLNAQNRFEGNADTGVRLLFRRVELR